MTVRATWLGHAVARLTWGDTVVYVDPVDLKAKKNPPADLVLLTNPKPGHTSPEDVAMVRGPDTVVAGPPDALRALGRSGRAIAAGEEFEFGGATIRAVPASTTRTEFFPAAEGWLGYLITTPSTTIYVAGMTDHLPESPEIRADIAFLPISGRYVMDVETAREIGEQIGAKTLLPLLVKGDRFFRTPGFTTRV